MEGRVMKWKSGERAQECEEVRRNWSIVLRCGKGWNVDTEDLGAKTKYTVASTLGDKPQFQ